MVISKLYRMVESKVDKDENAPQTSVKNNKKSRIDPEDLNKVFYFQPEDEIIEKGFFFFFFFLNKKVLTILNEILLIIIF